MIKLGLWLLGGILKKQSATSHHNKGMLSMSFLAVGIKLDHLAEAVLVGFLLYPDIHYSARDTQIDFQNVVSSYFTDPLTNS